MARTARGRALALLGALAVTAVACGAPSPAARDVTALQAADGPGDGGQGGASTSGQDGGDGTPGRAALPPPGEEPPAAVQKALASWRGFPVRASKRPIVMTGWPAYTDQRRAYGPGVELYAMNPDLQFTNPRQMPDAPARVDGYPIIDAEAALDQLHSEPPVKDDPAERVFVHRLRFGTATYWTDRGMQALPTWIVDYGWGDSPDTGPDSADETAYVLAVAPPARYTPEPPDEDEFAELEARDDKVLAVSRDDRTLIIPREWASYEAGDRTWCDVGLKTQVFETDTAVAFRAWTQSTRNPDPHCADADYWPRFEVRLASPLGDRVVFAADDDTAFPWPVLPCGAKTRVEVPRCTPPPRPHGVVGTLRVGTHYGSEFGPTSPHK